jgi:hypothetical protein
MKTIQAKRNLTTHARTIVIPVILGLGMAATSPAFAQTPVKPVPQDPDSNRPDETLSEKLDRSKGVIRPPSGVDPEIRKPAPVPNPGTTRVIPPPGTRGGDPSVQPK